MSEEFLKFLHTHFIRLKNCSLILQSENVEGETQHRPWQSEQRHGDGTS